MTYSLFYIILKSVLFIIRLSFKNLYFLNFFKNLDLYLKFLKYRKLEYNYFL